MAEDKRERAFQLYHVQGRACADVARELGTSTASVIRWSRSWMNEHPELAKQTTGRTPAHKYPLTAPPAPEVKTIAQAPAWIEAMRASAETQDAERDADALLGPETPAPPAPPSSGDDAPPPPLPENADAATIVRHQIAELQSFIAQARRSSQLETAQRFTRSLVELTNALRQLEKAARQDDGVIVFKRADVDAAIEEIDNKAKGVEDEPIICARCGHELRREKAEK